MAVKWAVSQHINTIMGGQDRRRIVYNLDNTKWIPLIFNMSVRFQGVIFSFIDTYCVYKSGIGDLIVELCSRLKLFFFSLLMSFLFFCWRLMFSFNMFNETIAAKKKVRWFSTEPSTSNHLQARRTLVKLALHIHWVQWTAAVRCCIWQRSVVAQSHSLNTL